MVDSGIKKVIIPKESLPAISGDSQAYILRYRIVSDDKNRYSHWSPQYKISLDPVSAINYSLNVNQSNQTFTLVWESVPDTPTFDIYIKIDTNDWAYITSISGTSYSALINSSWTHIQLAVQIPTYPKKRYPDATLFVTTQTNV